MADTYQHLTLTERRTTTNMRNRRMPVSRITA